MSGLRLRKTFNRLVTNQFGDFLKKGAAALMIAGSLALPAQAHHNNNDDLNVRNSSSNHSQEVRSIQDKFNRAVRDRRMILVDRDWIQINRALNDVRNDTELRNRYLAEYLLRYGRLHLPTDFFKNTRDEDIFLSPHTRVFTAYPQGKPLKVCTIFGGRGVMDGRSAVRDFINPSNVVHGAEIAGASIRLDPDAAKYKKFVTYHEIAHCMDDYFLPKMAGAASHDERLAYYHRAETFSDVFSALIMARDEGITDMAETIASIRLANMALSGPYQTAWSSPLDSGYSASYVYATHRSVRAAQDYLDRNGTAGLAKMTYNEVADLASNIVSQNALNDLEAEALMYLFSNKFDLTVWDQVKDNVPYVRARYAYAVELKREMEEGLRAVLDLGHIPASQSALERITFAGAPYQRQAEARAYFDRKAQIAMARAVSAELVVGAGGRNATLDRLVETFSAKKDQWREALSSGSDAEKSEAMKKLEVVGYSLWLAAQQIKAMQPSSDSAPATAPAPVSNRSNGNGHVPS